MTNDNMAIVTIEMNPTESIERAMTLHEIVRRMWNQGLMVPEIDYGFIPNVKKPSLFQPGAQKLMAALGCRAEYVIERTEDFDKPLFSYNVTCNFIHIQTGAIVGSGIGHCNSREEKYGFRWVEAAEATRQGYDISGLPMRNGELEEADFAIEKAETGGKWGKPAEYWQQFKDAMADGTAKFGSKVSKNGNKYRTVIIGGTLYRVPNPNVYEQINTIQKMACKRALVMAALNTGSASSMFTQDVEDIADWARKMPNYSANLIDMEEGAVYDRDQFIVAMTGMGYTESEIPNVIQKYGLAEVAKSDNPRRYNLMLETITYKKIEEMGDGGQ